MSAKTLDHKIFTSVATLTDIEIEKEKHLVSSRKVEHNIICQRRDFYN